MIISGTKIADRILSRTKRRVEILKKQGLTPRLAIVLIGNNPASVTYTAKKMQAARQVGIKARFYHWSAGLTTTQVIKKLKKVQKLKPSGIIVQLPLPKQLDEIKILNKLDPELDIDLLTHTNWGKLASAVNRLEPPTPDAILEILKYHHISLVGKHVVIVGRGWLIGKPMANLLMKLPVTLTVCGQATKNLKYYTRQADVLISAVGQHNLIRGLMIKPKAVVIDAGFTIHHGKISGDVNIKEVQTIARLVTPTPGGVGPITVAKLMANVVANAEYLAKKRN